jgi:S-methylmethionine-dependent homocysteine/selenocysteine methylase/SAM-dependent methyltransferase
MASSVRSRNGQTTRDAGLAERRSSAYGRIDRLLAREECVILDGGIATELEELEIPGYELRDDAMWGMWALLNAPKEVMRVHRGYAEVGCDVISTDTWGIQSAMNGEHGLAGMASGDWMELARRGIRLARESVAEVGREGEAAVAFSLHGDVADEQGLERFELLARVFEEEPPDLVLLETMSLIQDVTFKGVEALVASGFPVWLSFRRCRQGLCGVFGQHWGGPEGDLFGRASRRFEEMGVRALLINCIPPDHVSGMLPWLRDFTDLPLGVYPNLGYYTESGWTFDRRIGGPEYAELAAGWREEGAQLIGGCCGVRPQHIAAAKTKLAGTRPGRRDGAFERYGGDLAGSPVEAERPPLDGWRDRLDRPLYPLPMPELLVEPGVFVPTQGSFLIWKHLFMNAIGREKRCLDVGCGSGLLTAQLALNGASEVHAIDIDERAVANTLSNAFRNGVADRVSGEQVDLYPWDPQQRYDVVVASLYQMPNDPIDQLGSHRPLDYWGRNLFDHLLSLLPSLLEPEGRAYIMQLSILSQAKTLRQLQQDRLRSQVVDFAFLELGPALAAYEEQIGRVEELSDAYHLRFGEENTMVAYLLEIALEEGMAPRERRKAS